MRQLRQPTRRLVEPPRRRSKRNGTAIWRERGLNASDEQSRPTKNFKIRFRPKQNSAENARISCDVGLQRVFEFGMKAPHIKRAHADIKHREKEKNARIAAPHNRVESCCSVR